MIEYTPVKMASSLSPAQAEVLAYYKRFMSEHGRVPSLREAAKSLSREISNVHYHLKNLEKQGHLVRTGGYRGVQLVEKQSKIVPLVGTVACGEPITIFEESEEHVQVPENWILNGYAHYALRAKGDSMVQANIGDGDVLLIRQQQDVEDGDIGVVATGEPPFETATLKTIYHTKGALMLVPQNEKLEPYVVKKGEIRGKLVGVIREYAD